MSSLYFCADGKRRLPPSELNALAGQGFGEINCSGGAECSLSVNNSIGDIFSGGE